MSKEKKNEIIVLTDVSMIATVVQRGMGDEIVRAAGKRAPAAQPSTTDAAPACRPARDPWPRRRGGEGDRQHPREQRSDRRDP